MLLRSVGLPALVDRSNGRNRSNDYGRSAHRADQILRGFGLHAFFHDRAWVRLTPNVSLGVSYSLNPTFRTRIPRYCIVP